MGVAAWTQQGTVAGADLGTRCTARAWGSEPSQTRGALALPFLDEPLAANGLRPSMSCRLERSPSWLDVLELGCSRRLLSYRRAHPGLVGRSAGQGLALLPAHSTLSRGATAA